MPERFLNRSDAGRQLAAELLPRYGGRSDVLVLGLPRGGVPVAFEIAVALDAPLDVFVVRKLGLPGHEEFGIGAIASGGVRVVDDTVLRSYGVDADTLDRISDRERLEPRHRVRSLLPSRSGRRRHARPCATSPTTSCVWKLRSHSTPWDCGTRTSNRLTMRKSTHCSSARRPARTARRGSR